jgi:hypothetical protein
MELADSRSLSSLQKWGLTDSHFLSAVKHSRASLETTLQNGGLRFDTLAVSVKGLVRNRFDTVAVMQGGSDVWRWAFGLDAGWLDVDRYRCFCGG